MIEITRQMLLYGALGILLLSVVFFAWVALLPQAPLTPVDNTLPRTGIVAAEVIEASPSVSVSPSTTT